ncbi:MAG TPA: hypothetical protein VL853_01565 [Gemmatimonadales bacterium]|nr:hypothetical protein [Gemmatimonadales bacterium]
MRPQALVEAAASSQEAACPALLKERENTAGLSVCSLWPASTVVRQDLATE